MPSAKVSEMGSARRDEVGCRSSALRFGVASAIACAVALMPSVARADDTSSANLDFSKLADAIRDGGAALFPREGYGSRGGVLPQQDVERWLGVTPHVSLVARDWSGVQLLMGGHVSLTDQLRLSRSSRMVVSRVRLADGRLAPFMQLGLGQWRVDTDLVPVLPRDVELATQMGGGFELRLAPRWRLAIEYDYTVLYREERGPEQISPRIWGAFLATHASF